MDVVNRKNVKGSRPMGTNMLSLTLAILLALLAAAGIRAQEIGGRLVISSEETDSAPTILLRAYGMDEQGNPLELDPGSVSVQHAGQNVADVEVVGQYLAGTFSIIVVDIPPGVESSLPAISEAIGQYATAPYMRDQVDYVSVYQVGANRATELLAPVNFTNSVRNFLDQPLAVQSGPTALVDSLAGLLVDAATLNPKQDAMASIVLFSDGTDIVSSQYSPDEVGALAAELGVPVHTVWIENEDLVSEGQEEGRGYLAQLSRESRGLAARISQPAEVEAIWDRIARFRNHTAIQYRPETLSPGTHTVVLSLRSDPSVSDSVSVEIEASSPTIMVNLPPEDRQLTLETLDSPVRLMLTSEIAWLDEVEREITEAQLLINGSTIHDIDITAVERFTVDIDSFNYGSNTIQLIITDELGQRATSPELVLTVTEGETEIPETLEPQGGLGATIMRIVAIFFGVLFFLVVLFVVLTLISRRRVSARPGASSRPSRPPRAGRLFGRRSRGQPLASDAGEDERTAARAERQAKAASASPVIHYLEILEAVTRMPQYIELTADEHRIGRSPAQADILFENDITVSRFHATIVREGNDYRIYDADSSSGTWVNEQQLPDYGHQLMDGDEIRLGDARMYYRRG